MKALLPRIFLLSILTAFLTSGFAAEGDVDLSFADSGVAVVGSGQAGSFELAPPIVQVDQKIVVCGVGISTDGSHYAGYIWRLNPDGTLDQTFGESGRYELTTHFIDPPCMGLAQQNDGKIVLATINGVDDSIPVTDEETQVLRLDQNGNLDPTFGQAGVSHVNFVAGDNDGATALVVQPDGAIVLGVAVFPNTFGIARITADGIDDTSFGDAGRVSVTFSATADASSDVRGVVIDSLGRVLVAGSVGPEGPTSSAMAATRVLNDGAIDASFGTAGRVTFSPAGSYAFASTALLQADARIVLAGSAQAAGHNLGVAATRLLDNGTIDMSFGNGGYALIPIDAANSIDQAFGGAVRTDGTIILVGGSASAKPFMLQLDRQGAPKSDFGSAGIRIYDGLIVSNDTMFQTFGGMSTQDGKFVIAGSSGDNGTITTFVARVDGPAAHRGHSRHMRPRSGIASR